MSRNRTLWGSLLTLLIVIGFATPAFAQDAIDDAVAAVEDIQTQEQTDSQDDLVLSSQFEAPSPVMALDSHEGGEAEESNDPKLEWGGSFRFRQQYEYTEGGATGSNHPQGGRNRYRMRYRMLLDLKVTHDDFEAGVRLGSTNGATSANATIGSPISGNGDFATDFVSFRRAYGKIKFVDGLVRATFGLFGFPKEMYRSILTFDSDIALGGIHIAVAVMEEKDDKKKITQALYVNALLIYLSNNGGNIGDDPFYWAGTVDFRMGGLQAGAGFHAVQHLSTWTNGNAATGTSPRAGTAQFGAAGIGPEFAALEVYVKYDLSDMGMPLSVYAHVIYNTGGFRGFGALGGVTFKDGKGEGAIQIDLIYYYQQGHAWPQGWSDADTGRNGSMAGNTGIELNAKYYLTANVALGLECDFYALVEDTVVGGDDQDRGMTLIFDAYFEF